MFRALVLCLLSLVFAKNVINGSPCGGGSRSICKDVYIAGKCGMFDECVGVWSTSSWQKYRDDTSANCTVCKTLVKSIPIHEVKPLCSMLHLPDITQCEFAVEQFSSRFNVSFTKKTEENNADIVCNTISACESHIYIGGLNFGSLVCDDCKKLIATVQNIVADNKTADAIVDLLEKTLCDPLSDHIRDYCKETVKVHVPVLLHLIEIHLSPDDVCSLLHLCPKSQHSTINLNQLLHSKPVTSQEQSPEINNMKPCPGQSTHSWISRPLGRNSFMFTSYNLVHANQNEAIPECESCVAVVNQMKEVLKDPAFQSEIKKDMETQVCASLGFLREVCVKAIDNHFEKMILEAENVDSRAVCSVFKMCDRNVMARPQIINRQNAGVPGACQLCELLVEKIIDITVDKTSKESITAALDQLCILVPQRYKKRCDNFVENFGAEIVEAIIKGTAPTMACNLIGLCSGPLMQPISAVPAGSKYCTNCKVLVDLVYKELLQNGTEEEMKKWAKHMCTILPDTYASECNHLVEEYLPLVIRYLTESFTSEEVCEKIGFCPEQSGYQKALCLRGPAYWCLNRETAERCNATEICSTGRFTQSSARSLCDSRNRAQICASFELAAACGMTSECTKQLLLTYMHSVTHLLGLRPQLWSSASEGNMNQPNCTVCADMLAEWLTNRKYLGTPNFTVQICKKYSGSDDRAQCYRVWAQRYKIFRQMFRDNANPEAICKQMNLCQISATSPTSPCLENPLYAISSRRAAEQCGTLDLWNQVQKVETQPIKPATTEPPSRAVPPPPAESSACQGGPTTFCQTFETAQRCGDAGIRYCLEHVWFGSRPRRIIRAPPHLN